MTISDTIKQFKELGEYYCPEYQWDNEVLDNFKLQNPTLNAGQTLQLINILESGDQYDKIFVADLLYLYNDFDEKLLEPMVSTAIGYRDASFNRVFINPCIARFGYEKVVAIVKQKFIAGDIVEKIGVSKLLYWLRPDDRAVLDELIDEIKVRCKETDNIIELYHYSLVIKDVGGSSNLPKDAEGLTKIIKGNSSLEKLLYTKLGWSKK